jgi:hypothetical protein
VMDTTDMDEPMKCSSFALKCTEHWTTIMFTAVCRYATKCGINHKATYNPYCHAATLG